MSSVIKIFASFTLALLMQSQAAGATLSATPPPSIVPPGETYLEDYFLTDPGAFWFGIVLDWEQTAEVSIQVAVSDDPLISPFNYHVVDGMTATNNTEQAWSGMEIDVAGPATFSLEAPTATNVDASTKIVPPTRITLAGMDWPAPIAGTPTSEQLNFGLDVTAPTGDESVILTFRPITVPEPSSGALILLGGSMLAIRRRR